MVCQALGRAACNDAVDRRDHRHVGMAQCVVDVHHRAQHHAGRGARGCRLLGDGHLHVQVLVVLAHHHLGVAQVPDAEELSGMGPALQRELR